MQALPCTLPGSTAPHDCPLLSPRPVLPSPAHDLPAISDRHPHPCAHGGARRQGSCQALGAPQIGLRQRSGRAQLTKVDILQEFPCFADGHGDPRRPAAVSKRSQKPWRARAARASPLMRARPLRWGRTEWDRIPAQILRSGRRRSGAGRSKTASLGRQYARYVRQGKCWLGLPLSFCGWHRDLFKYKVCLWRR